MTENAAGKHPPSAGRRRRNGSSAPTIYDIAELAGVNPSTVSRALSKPGRINVRTEERIRAAAKQLDYRLNPIARALPTGRTMTFGLLIADITNPVLFGTVRGAEQEATASGYTLVIAESQESGEREAATAERVLPSVDGLILATARMTDEQIVDLAQRKPVVLVNREVEGVDGIVPDLRPGVDAAVQHLRVLGHRSVAYLAGPATSWASRRRAEAIAEACERHGVEFAPRGPGVPTLEGGRTAYDLIPVGATAVFAYNDLMAIGVMREAAERERSIPDDLSVIGFDDIFGADFANPPLTTIRSPLTEAGRRAVQCLLGDGLRDADVHALSTELVIRGSTAPLAGAS